MAIIDMLSLQNQIDTVKSDITKLKESVFPNIYTGGFKTNINLPVTVLDTITTVNVNHFYTYDNNFYFSVTGWKFDIKVSFTSANSVNAFYNVSVSNDTKSFYETQIDRVTVTFEYSRSTSDGKIITREGEVYKNSKDNYWSSGTFMATPGDTFDLINFKVINVKYRIKVIDI